jgi:hypothetical protein
MNKLLEIKEVLKKLYSKQGLVFDAVLKFIFSLAAVLMINANMGAMAVLKTPAAVVGISLVCALVPKNLMVLILAAVIVAHGYAFSMELALFLAVVMFVMFLFYFRFSAGDGLVLILMPILFSIKIPFLLPIALGLLTAPFSIVAAACGTIMYFIINEIHGNMDTLLNASSADGLSNMFEIANHVFTNQALYLSVIVFSVTIVAVYVVRKLSVPYSWAIAIGVGTVIQMVILLMSVNSFGLADIFSVSSIIIGNIISVILSLLLALVKHNVDYKCTESVQFEDDDYYYYVKAVPKVTSAKKKKKRIRREIQRES